jgi:hypothetical protein
VCVEKEDNVGLAWVIDDTMLTIAIKSGNGLDIGSQKATPRLVGGSRKMHLHEFATMQRRRPTTANAARRDSRALLDRYDAATVP